MLRKLARESKAGEDWIHRAYRWEDRLIARVRVSDVMEPAESVRH